MGLKKKFSLCSWAAPLAAGLCAALLRIMGAPLWLLLGGGAALCACLWLAACRMESSTRPTDPASFPGPGLVFSLFSALSLLLFFASGIARLMQGDVFQNLGSLLQVIAVFAAGMCGLLRLFCPEPASHSAPLSLIPVFSFCILLILFYRANSSVPQISAFGGEILTFSAVLGGLYLSASGKYQPVKPRTWCFFTFLGLSALWMELIVLIGKPALLARVNDFSAPTLLALGAAGCLLFAGLFYPPFPVYVPKEDPQDAPPQA